MPTSFLELLQRCADSFRPATAHGFGMEYELLCTDLSLQWLRIRLWADSVGLSLAEGISANSILLRPDIEPTITLTVDCLISLLTEIEFIRTKYQPQDLQRVKASSTKSTSSPKPLDRLTNLDFQQRIVRNQKKKSLFAKAKWALRDARRFEDRLRRLKSYIDALESIARVAGFTTVQLPPETDARGEIPPPYSAFAEAPFAASASTINDPISTQPSPDSILYRNLAARRYGCIFPPGFSICAHGCAMQTPTVPQSPRSSTTPSSSCSSSRSSVEIFKSFRVSMTDPTSKVLPAALAKYNINCPPEQYALYVIYGDCERCLGANEKPLQIFKRLNREGKKPMFMLRRISGLEAKARRSYDEACVMDSLLRGEYDGKLGC